MAENVLSTPKPIIPICAAIYRPFAPLSYAFIRFCTGAIFVPHGIQKLSGGATADKFVVALGLAKPAPWAVTMGMIELAGGIMLALGLLTRPAALLLAIELLVMIFAVHIHNGFAWNSGGIQYPVMLLALCIAALFRGGGRYSLDRLIGREF
ncbi:MAG: DoxX family protein [Stellaceae bacterium]